MTECICDFSPACDGSGTIHCEGCGGDSCICGVCGSDGVEECPGCLYCERDEDRCDCEEEETVP